MSSLPHFILLFLLALPYEALGDVGGGLQCFVPGECLDSMMVDALPLKKPRDCLHHCQVLYLLYYILNILYIGTIHISNYRRQGVVNGSHFMKTQESVQRCPCV